MYENVFFIFNQLYMFIKFILVNLAQKKVEDIPAKFLESFLESPPFSWVYYKIRNFRF